MNSQSRMILGAVAIIAAIGGFWFLLLAPKRADVATTSDKITQAQARRDAAVALVSQAEQAKAGYLRDYSTVARLGKAVPADDDIASLVYELETIARANKIDFRAVKLSGGDGAAAPAPAAATTTPPADGKKPDATAPTATPVAPVVAQTPPGAVVGTAGLLTIPFSFTFDGSYLKLQRFLKAINGLATTKRDKISVHGRLLTVDGFSLTPGRLGLPKLKAVVNATAYIVPTPDSAATASPQNPGATTGSTTALITPNAQGAGR